MRGLVQWEIVASGGEEHIGFPVCLEARNPERGLGDGYGEVVDLNAVELSKINAIASLFLIMESHIRLTAP